MIKTILFDLDGTLINTNYLIMASFKHTLNRYYPNCYNEEDIIDFIGEPLEDSFRSVDHERVDEMVDVYRRHNIAMHDELVEDYPNVFDTVQTLHQKGYRLGIVTSKQRTTVEMGLKLTNLDQFFSVVVTVDDVEQPKPHAEPVLKALKRMGASADSAVMVGDSSYDIQAGKNAGVRTVGVAWSIKGKTKLQAENPDIMIDDMSELLSFTGAVST